LVKRARSSFAAIPRSFGPPKVDILPSTRKRISSGCAGKGRTTAAFFCNFDRDFPDEGFAFFVTRVFYAERREVGLPNFDLCLRAGIRRYLLRWPGVATSVSKRFQHAAVESA